MQSWALLAPLLTFPAASVQVSSHAEGAAVQKVVDMLRDMVAKAKGDTQNEEVNFASFNQWCSDETARLEKQVATEAEALESLTAEGAKLTSEVHALGEEIAGLNNDVTTCDAEMKMKAAQRADEHKTFLASQQDYAESIDALERAVATLKAKAVDVPASLFVQVGGLSRVPQDVREVVEPFLDLVNDMREFSKGEEGLGLVQARAADPDYLSYTAPEAKAYESSSGSIAQLLDKLRDEFVAKKTDLEKEEMNSRHSFEMLSQDLTSSIETAKDSISEKTSEKAEKEQAAALGSRQAQETADTKTADEKLLSDATTECHDKKLSFEEKQHMRAEEIQALEQAIEVLASEIVQGTASKHLALPQARKKHKKSAAVLLQQSPGAPEENGVREHLAQYLGAQSKRLHSNNLAMLAEKAAYDPFIKVRKMISEMITRLMAQANEEAEKKGFCDKELSTNKLTRKKLTETLDGLSAEIENGKARIQMLMEDGANLADDISAIVAAVTQASALRAAEQKRNDQTVGDAAAAQEAVQQAMALLKDFYARAAGATALTQINSRRQPWGETKKVRMGTVEWQAVANPSFNGVVDKGHKEGMQTFGETYQGQQEEAGGVLAMLEVVESDFGNLKAETMATETQSKAAHEAFVAESEKDKAVKEKKKELCASDQVSAEAKLREDTGDYKFTQNKMAAADRYYEQLEPQCINSGVSYEDRTRARREEIQSLREALAILNGEELA